jgi:hypothetical protein
MKTVCLQKFLPPGERNLNCNKGVLNGDRITTELQLACVIVCRKRALYCEELRTATERALYCEELRTATERALYCEELRTATERKQR